MLAIIQRLWTWLLSQCSSHRVVFARWDEPIGYTVSDRRRAAGTHPGTVHFVAKAEGIDAASVEGEADRFRIIGETSSAHGEATSQENGLHVRGFTPSEGKWVETPVQLMPGREELFSRFGGLLETDVLADCRVLLVALGSLGADIAQLLTKSGVEHFCLLDHDRLEVCNLLRHVCGIQYVGWLKTDAVKRIIQEKNPRAEVETFPEKVSYQNVERVRELVKRSDLVICTVDEQEGRRIINRLCVEQNKPLIIAGAFRRAYGGQVFWIRPHETPCYQCFLQRLPQTARDVEVSSAEHAARIAYSDRPVPIEPGLAVDIAPIVHMATKLAVQQLMRGKDWTFKHLDEDLTASLYLYLNRREPGTDYEKLEPLGCFLDGMRILRWYGIDAQRLPECAVCGDFHGHWARQQGLAVSPQDLELIRRAERETDDTAL